MHFGEHVTIDGYGGDPLRLDDGRLVRKCLDDLCARLGMHPLALSQVVPAPDNGKKDPGGWSGALIIAESHISVHTFPKRRFLSADVYTCHNGIDRAFIEEFFKSAFCLQEVEIHFLKRGLRYPAYNLA